MAMTLSDFLGGPDAERKLACRMSVEFLKVLLERQDKDLRADDALLSVYFEYPGSITSRFDYAGIKEGVFSKKQRGFRVWIAVPESLMNSPDFGDFYLARLREAIEIAGRRFVKHSIPFSVNDHLKIVEAMAERLPAIKVGLESNPYSPPWRPQLKDAP
jgi:hypothetical protein